MPTESPDRTVLGYECKFVVYCEPPHPGAPDLHLVKEVVHYSDKTTSTNLRKIPNFKRDFYVTRPAHRKHKQKKESEDLDKVQRYTCTQAELPRRVALALEQPGARPDLRMLARARDDDRIGGQYLYGSDILSTAVLKEKYLAKAPDLVTPFRVAVFDTEADVVNGTEQIIMATLSMGSKVYTAVQRSFVEGIADVQTRARELLHKYLGKMDAKDEDGNPITVNILQKRGIEWELEIVEDEFQVVRTTIDKAHQWSPDFLAIWNIDYDIPKCLEACKRAGVDPKDVFSDPSVPRAYRFCNYKLGKRNMLTASGVYKSLSNYEQWHTLYCPAGFYVIDAMCVYYRQRSQKGKLPSYGLDAILDLELGMRKLKFSEADGMSKIDWHMFMQSKYPLEYIIYNVFDCVSMEELDERTTDLQLAMPGLCGYSDFSQYKSQPRRVCDKLHYFALARGQVFGSTSDEMVEELDSQTISAAGLIVTLPAHLVADNGLCILEEDPNWRTNLRTQVYDLDVTASYPNAISCLNVSKATTKLELCKIKGVSELDQRMAGINLNAGHVNAVEIAESLFRLPGLEQMLGAFQAHIAQTEQVAADV